MARQTIEAEQAQEGDSIPGLDNAYVIDVETTELRAFSGTYNVSLGVMTAITFNDRYGNEGYLLVEPDHPLVVERV
jgi:hypothetical protein